jgi:uncharacterized DUF497 family protein
MDFEWDEAKNWSNKLKHGVGFETAYQFEWSRFIIEPDLRKDYGETRFIARGYGPDDKGYVVALTLRGTWVRIISIRRFNRREYLRYGK